MKTKTIRRSTPILLGLFVLASGVVTPMIAAAGDTHSFGADADTEVVKSSPTSNFGSAESLRADESPEVESYLRFVVDGLDGGVEKATLRLYATSGSADSPILHAAGVDWSEDDVTWDSRPEREDTVLDDRGNTKTGSWVEYDVTDAVTGNGTFAFNLVPEDGDGFAFPSREASDHHPELVVETDGATGGAGSPEPTAPSGAPNVLVIVTDDQRHDTLEVMPRTRQWLADAGTTYTQGYATTPLCCPARATLFSGRYMHNHGVLDNDQEENLDQRYTMPRYLKDAGYQTALIGKYLTGWSSKKAPPDFDHYALTNGGYVNAKYNVDGKTKTAAYTTDFMRDQTLDFLDNFEDRDSKPWFMYVAGQAPHDDSNENYPPAARHKKAAVPKFEPAPSRPEKDMSDKPKFLRNKKRSAADSKEAHDDQLRTLMSLDEMIDATFRRLESNGELQNTLVIFTSDNGYHWGEHGVNSKGLPYSESVRVPFIVRWPGHVAKGATNNDLVAGVDIMPTVLDATNTNPAKLGYPLDGRSLLDSGGRDKIFLEFHAGHRDYPSWASIRTRGTQYIEWYGKDDRTVTWREYYDMDDDPYQIDNVLADDDPDNDPDVDALSEQLKDYRDCRGSQGSSACP